MLKLLERRGIPEKELFYIFENIQFYNLKILRLAYTNLYTTGLTFTNLYTSYNKINETNMKSQLKQVFLLPRLEIIGVDNRTHILAPKVANTLLNLFPEEEKKTIKIDFDCDMNIYDILWQTLDIVFIKPEFHRLSRSKDVKIQKFGRYKKNGLPDVRTRIFWQRIK